MISDEAEVVGDQCDGLWLSIIILLMWKKVVSLHCLLWRILIFLTYHDH